MSSLSSPRNVSEHVAYKRLYWVGPLAALVAISANLIVFSIARIAFGLQFDLLPFGTNAQNTVTALSVILAVAFPAFVATFILALLVRLTSRPIRVFRIVSAIALIFSFSAPLTQGMHLATKVVLSLMHVVAAITIVGILTTLASEK